MTGEVSGSKMELYFIVLWFKITKRIVWEMPYTRAATPLWSLFYRLCRMAIYIVIMLMEERGSSYFAKAAAGYLLCWVLSFSSTCPTPQMIRTEYQFSSSHVLGHPFFIICWKTLPTHWSKVFFFFFFNTLCRPHHLFWCIHALCAEFCSNTKLHWVPRLLQIHETTWAGTLVNFPADFSIWVRTVYENFSTPWHDW